MTSTIPVYYINLASRPDRRAFMERQFERLGITAERIEAVRADEVSDDLIAFHRTPRSLWHLAAGDLACGLGHQRCWARLAESGQSAALILEDDAILDAVSRDFLDRLLQRLQADLLKLETFNTPVHLGTEVYQVGATTLRELCSSQMGGAAYVMSVRTAQRSLASPLRDLMGIDRFLFGRGGLHLLRSRVLQAVPSPCIQIDKLDAGDHIGDSDIATTRPSAMSDRSRPARDPVAMAGPHLDHVARLLMLAARDWTALRSRPVAVPFAGGADAP